MKDISCSKCKNLQCHTYTAMLQYDIATVSHLLLPLFLLQIMKQKDTIRRTPMIKTVAVIVPVTAIIQGRLNIMKIMKFNIMCYLKQ